MLITKSNRQVPICKAYIIHRKRLCINFFIINDYLSEIEGKQIVVDWYKDYTTALEKIKDRANHIYLVDYRLGNKTGLDLLSAANDLSNDSPIVLLTGKGNKAIDIQAMQYGATDYLIKSELSTEFQPKNEYVLVKPIELKKEEVTEWHKKQLSEPYRTAHLHPTN